MNTRSDLDLERVSAEWHRLKLWQKISLWALVRLGSAGVLDWFFIQSRNFARARRWWFWPRLFVVGEQRQIDLLPNPGRRGTDLVLIPKPQTVYEKALALAFTLVTAGVMLMSFSLLRVVLDTTVGFWMRMIAGVLVGAATGGAIAVVWVFTVGWRQLQREWQRTDENE